MARGAPRDASSPDRYVLALFLILLVRGNCFHLCGWFPRQHAPGSCFGSSRASSRRQSQTDSGTQEGTGGGVPGLLRDVVIEKIEELGGGKVQKVRLRWSERSTLCTSTGLAVAYVHAATATCLAAWLYGPDDGPLCALLLLCSGCAGTKVNHDAFFALCVEEHAVSLPTNEGPAAEKGGSLSCAVFQQFPLCRVSYVCLIFRNVLNLRGFAASKSSRRTWW